MTLRVELVAPEGEIWAGDAQRVIAKTLDGDIGILTGHTPVLGILAEGSIVRILPEDDQAGGGELVTAGSIIVRQRGTKIKPGDNIGVGRDHTLFALIDGYVKFGHHSRTQRCVNIYTEFPDRPSLTAAEENPTAIVEV